MKNLFFKLICVLLLSACSSGVNTTDVAEIEQMIAEKDYESAQSMGDEIIEGNGFRHIARITEVVSIIILLERCILLIIAVGNGSVKHVRLIKIILGVVNVAEARAISLHGKILAVLDKDIALKGCSVVASELNEVVAYYSVGAYYIKLTSAYYVDILTEGAIDKVGVPEAAVSVKSRQSAFFEGHITAVV